MFETGKYGVQELVNGNWKWIKRTDDEDLMKLFIKDLYIMPKNKGKTITEMASKYRPVKEIRIEGKLIWINSVTGKEI